MEDWLRAYQERLEERDIDSWDPPEPKMDKAHPNGTWLPFYGLTCIAWISRESELFRELCGVQGAIKARLAAAGLGDFYAFLEPESFHMTVCDLVAGSLPVPDKHRDELVDRVYRAFEQIERPGPVRCQVKDLGLKRTITAMVRFPDARELSTVLDMEQRIKKTAQVDERDFVGHISLAYLVPRPREAVRKEACGIKRVMRAYKHYAFGEFVFDRFDLAAFADMNAYLPILTKNLVDGAVSRC